MGDSFSKVALPQDAPVSPRGGVALEHGRGLPLMFARGMSMLQLLPCCVGSRRHRQQSLKCEESPPLMLEGADGEKVFSALYAVGDKIGEGAFGKVYTCKPMPGVPQRIPLQEGERTCVKMVPTAGRHGSKASSILQEEKLELLKLFEQLSHSNIVRYHRFVQTSDTLYIVMEMSEGPGLLEYIEESGALLPLDTPTGVSVRGIAKQMLGAIAAVHSLGMMHRDVKPDNFRFKDRTADRLQLLDFGAAKPHAGEAPTRHSVTGTLLFVAPEVFDGFYCRSCDLWSVGVVYFILVAGHAPFDTSDVAMLRSMHQDPVLTGDSLLRGMRWKKAPQGAHALARGLLAVDPASRLSAAAGLQLPWFTQEEGGESLADAPGPHPLQRSSSRSASIAELRRSYFVWNLADGNSSGEEDTPRSRELCGSSRLVAER